MTAYRRVLLAAASTAVLAICGALAGCGVPVDQRPSALPRAGVPFELLAPSSPSSSTTAPAPSPNAVAVRIFLLGSSGHLVPVTRQIPSAQLSLASVLGVLVDGPTAAETLSGLASAIPPQASVIDASVAPGGLATVNVGGTFGQLVGQAQIDAVAQVVFTATALALPRTPAVTGVTFQLSGQPVEVPVEDGAQVPVVNTSGFQSLAPQPTTRTPSA